MQRVNVWLTIENALAVSWWQWVQWYRNDGDPANEPSIADWDKNALTKVIDLDWSAKAYKKATIPQLAPKDQWRLWNIYDIKVPQWIEAGFNQHGRAEEGGDIGIAGIWKWTPGSTICKYEPLYPWKPNQVVLFMPDTCNDPECTTTNPATEITDVSLVMGQPPREFIMQPTGLRITQ